MWPPGTIQLSSLFQCTLGSAYSPLSFSSPVGLNSVRSLGCHLLVFGITQLLPAVRPAVFVCVVCDGKVSDPLVCWGPLHLLSFRSLFLASGKDCGCRAVVVIGMSVSKESVMSTSWFGTVPHSFFLLFLSAFLLLSSLNPLAEIRAVKISGSQRISYWICIMVSSRVSAFWAVNWGESLNQVVCCN